MKPSYRQCAEAEAAGIIRERREPLPVEHLVSEDQRRLAVATGSSKPMPASEVEDLLADLRRIEAEHKSQA